MQTHEPVTHKLPHDLTAGLVVFLVALPLCLGVALASNAPLFSGLLAGIVGGIIVGILSGSQSSVSGPAAGLTAVVAAQILTLGSFQAFLLAVVLAGGIQIALGSLQAGSIASFIPSSVIKGLLAAIGIIIILKQIPYVFGIEVKQFEWNSLLDDIHPGALTIGIISILTMEIWNHWYFLKKSPVPAPLVVVILGVAIGFLFNTIGSRWAFSATQLVQVPVANSIDAFFGFLQLPDFTQIANAAIYVAAITIAAVASLETLLNLEAVDKLDPRKRVSPPNRELVAQGIGNVVSGLIGGLPITSVVIRSSVNLNAGGRTKVSAVFHGVLLLFSILFLSEWLNRIPLASLAAILVMTGFKLASPKLVKQMWKQGRYQFIPFIVTVLAIVLTDLLIGVLIGLAVSVLFILNSGIRHPIRHFIQRHCGDDVLHIELPNQLSFLNRAALVRVLHEAPRGGHILLDANQTDYIDPDVLDIIDDFRAETDPPYDVIVSLTGFHSKYNLPEHLHFEK